MTNGKIANVKISGIASAVPDNIKDLSEYIDIFGEKAVKDFAKMTGVKTRCITHDKQTASDLCYVAAENLLGHLGWARDTIDAAILVTQCPDYNIPATACVLHKRLGLSRDCIAFDVNQGCSGFSYGVFIGASMLQNPSIKRVLVLAGDTSNKSGISKLDKSTAMLFGEAGSAAALERTENSDDCISFMMKTDGNGFKNIIVPYGAARNRNGKREPYEFEEGIVRSDYDLYMNGQDVLDFALFDVLDTINEFKEKFGVKYEAVDMFVMHQANLFMLKAMAKKAKIPMEKIPISIDRFGNTSVTSIPLTICDACENIEENKLLSLMCVGFGIGLSWGIVTFKVSSRDCLKVLYANDYYTEGGL